MADDAAAPIAAEQVLDGKRLRGALTAAALAGSRDHVALRATAVSILRPPLQQARNVVRARLEAGAGGLASAQALSAIADEVITTLYDFTTVHVFRSRNPTQAERIAVLATGGYGRGLLAPYSDVDLLFLRPYKATPHEESVIEFMLYALWDLGFKVGHASRTIDDCLRLARQDFTIRTSLLDVRQLSGDEKLAAALKRRFRAELVKGTAAEFVAAKLQERDERHAKAGASRYMVEPNVKDGKGALRDLNTLFWISQYLQPAPAADGVVRLKMFDKGELTALTHAVNFMWAVRCHLHFIASRAQERLSFEYQPEVARRMGYGDRGDAPAVERFMRRYFTTSKQVGALTRAFCAKLEADQAKSAPQGLSRFWPVRRRHRKALHQRGFHEEGGRLNVSGPETFAQDPVNLIRLFRLSDQLDLDLHPDAVTAVHRSVKLITPAVRRDPAAISDFLHILARGRSTYRALTLMNEAGVLGRFVPEFGRVVGQMQFNMYHAYTVDEHTLRAVDVIAEIAAGRLGDEHPLSVQIMPLIADREALFLAMLLHDTGKGGREGQEIGGAKAAEQACRRLGLEDSRVRLVAWLVRHHLVMSDYAQKRDVRDPRTVQDFAAIVKSPERLRMLLVLTVADIRAVGPGVWNGWKGQLLRELYMATEAVFRGGRSLPTAARAEEVRGELTASDPQAAAFAAVMQDDYVSGFEPADIARHAGLAAVARGPEGAAVSVRPRRGQRATEVAVAARDRQGLFADLAGALAIAGAEIVAARVHTSRDGQALDVFTLEDGALGEGGPSHRNRRLPGELSRAARGESHRPAGSLLGPPSARVAAFEISPVVVIDSEASADSSVVEASGRDRPGLLASLARVIAEAGLSIQSAHIGTYGARAVDVFYVQDQDGRKLAKAQAAALTSALYGVLSSQEAPAAHAARLPRARASAVR